LDGKLTVDVENKCLIEKEKQPSLERQQCKIIET